MAIRSRPPKDILTGAELDAVQQSQHPGLKTLGHADLVSLARRLRDHRTKARDIARSRRRVQRGKAEPRGAGATPDESGVLVKKQIFAAALRRVNARLEHLTSETKSEARRERTTELLRSALAAKEASEPHHPGPGRTARKGMRSVENEVPDLPLDPRQIGSVSQQVKNAQAKRDS
ncbi:hypothetical protein [Roseococcus pinisoli]|uniref:Uncharacterized protein n=1 Tax=Roseococcus pinisoli TaxID=2835040 RepID=A0ABS5QGV4_9PROT|nr:hypothetical protein [Roseococcus pinisoli]MBS7812905.1 hypothetical protein [Roseococcus pinisoli]